MIVYKGWHNFVQFNAGIVDYHTQMLDRWDICASIYYKPIQGRIGSVLLSSLPPDVTSSPSMLSLFLPLFIFFPLILFPIFPHAHDVKSSGNNNAVGQKKGSQTRQFIVFKWIFKKT